MEPGRFGAFLLLSIFGLAPCFVLRVVAGGPVRFFRPGLIFSRAARLLHTFTVRIIISGFAFFRVSYILFIFKDDMCEQAGEQDSLSGGAWEGGQAVI
ncbi:hypothetical protein B0T24DRAFT_612965 [Lasiosphaeria ovina]|uniref:Uncharacterized protein n=1 Tax=Lasiosphaeria ovina TaxID=92902 RepID=A0AAE0TSS8_9PEZI|nr:hypothetical protein B0T24DRAFT_612965 [Lasiosphaeria ovina]